METSASAGMMIMYEDESVDVRYGNGARLQLSPCGSEFTLEKPMESSAHPLQPTERVRQRTRFTISIYKDMIVAALAFRNQFANRPYLPEELIPADHKKPFFSTDSDVQWPEWSSCDTELGHRGETIVKSEDGKAVFTLSPSGEEFSVKFTCSLSRTRNQQHLSVEAFRNSNGSPGSQQQVGDLIRQTTNDETKEVYQGREGRRNEPIRSRSSSPRLNSTAQPKPESMYQSTTVDQHHSSCAVASIWSYPLSLARHLWMARLSKSEDVRAEGMKDLTQAHGGLNMPAEKRLSHLPQALPLTCLSPHWHRWRVKDPLAKSEQSDHNFPAELVKVMWCHGVTYRILSGAVSVVEVSPGDGSVIRSNGVLSTYFIHHRPDLQSGQVKEVTYHLNNLPPDIPGQLYSICSIVSRASRLGGETIFQQLFSYQPLTTTPLFYRILTCYNEAKQSLKLPAIPSCLHEGGHFCKPTTEENASNLVSVEQHVNVTQMVENRSDVVAAELEKIKRFNFLLENNNLFGSEKQCAEESSSAGAEKREAVNENYIVEALQRTSKAIEDIDALISAATLTGKSPI